MMNSRIRWAGYVARIAEKRNAYIICGISQRERDHQEGQDACGWIILRWIMENRVGVIDWISLAEDRDSVGILRSRTKATELVS
jgi:hypothetical protein